LARQRSRIAERAVYRHEDPERAIDEIQFDPFHSPWAPGASTSRAPHPTAVEAHAEPAALHLVESATPVASVEATGDFRSAVAAYERSLLEDALRRNRYNQRATAAALGLSYDQLRHALKRHKLQDSAA
jgi:psp operon transcriptional activator